MITQMNYEEEEEDGGHPFDCSITITIIIITTWAHAGRDQMEAFMSLRNTPGSTEDNFIRRFNYTDEMNVYYFKWKITDPCAFEST